MVELVVKDIENIVHGLVRDGSLDFDSEKYLGNIKFMCENFWDKWGKESWNGNAGRNCIAVNFLFDGRTGEIVYIGNDISKYKNNLREGTFLCYVDFRNKKFSLRDLIINGNLSGTPLEKKVLDTLMYTIYQFNMRYECK